MPEAKDTLAELLVVEALGRIDSSLEKIDDRLDEQGKIMVHQQAILDEHVRRTDLLEKKIETDIAAAKKELPKAIEEQLKSEREKTMERRKKNLIFALKVGGGVAGLSSGGWGLMHVLKWLAGLVS